MRQAVLALDVGLTVVKASLIAEDGSFLAQGRRIWEGHRALAGPGNRGRDPWPAIVAAVEALWRQDASLRAGTSVRAVASSVAAQTGIGLDRTGSFLALDAVSAPWRRLSGGMRNEGGRGKSGRVGGESGTHADLRPAADPGWGPGGMIRWGYAGVLTLTVWAARRQRPDLLAGLQRVGPLHAYVVLRLSGRYVTDPASGPEASEWPEPVLRWTGLGKPNLPAIQAGEEPVGRLTEEAARQLGLDSGVWVVTGGHDGVCSSFGAGAYHPGDMGVTLSTNFVPRPVAGLRVQGVFGYSIRPGAWAWVDGLPLCGTQRDQARKILWPWAKAGEEPWMDGQNGEPDLSDLPDLPYLAPDRIEQQTARLERLLAEGIPPENLWLAVQRGLARALKDRIVEGRAMGLTPSRAVLTGGASRDGLLIRLLGRELDLPVRRVHPEAGSLGAAALAAPVAGWAPSPEDALSRWRSVSQG